MQKSYAGDWLCHWELRENTLQCVLEDVWEDDVNVTVTSEHYIDMLENFLRLQLKQLELEECDVWFQQDGAMAHTA